MDDEGAILVINIPKEYFKKVAKMANDENISIEEIATQLMIDKIDEL